MIKDWEKQLSCAEECSRCNTSLKTKDRRILSVIDHQPICVDCKKEEQTRPDHEDASRQMMAQCIAETSKPYGDPAAESKRPEGSQQDDSHDRRQTPKRAPEENQSAGKRGCCPQKSRSTAEKAI
jgi:hypothetical protein